MMKYFSKRESNYFIRKYEVNGVMGFILMIWDERKLNFQMPFRDLWSDCLVCAYRTNIIDSPYIIFSLVSASAHSASLDILFYSCTDINPIIIWEIRSFL
jgi:hypothetical protein